MKKICLSFCFCMLFTAMYAQNITKDPIDVKKKQVAILPVTLTYNLGRGQSKTQTVTVDNNLDSTQRFIIYLGDWERDSAGNHKYYDPGTYEHSCSRWITTDKTFIEVPAHEKGTVEVTLTMPDSAEAVSEMKWGMLFLEGFNEKRAPAKTGNIQQIYNSTMRVGVHLYQTPPGELSKELKMLEFKATPEKWIYRIACRNGGATQLKCKATIELTNQANNEKTTVEPKTFPLFPGQYRQLDIKIPNTLAKGKYTAIAMIDAGDDDIPLEAAQLEIEVQ